MMIANLFNLKQTNGMFFYSFDYIKELGCEKILVNKKLYGKISDIDNLVPCNLFTFLMYIVVAKVKGAYIYTPTPHPIPFYKKQLVVMHDYYPFKYGRLSSLKLVLFKLGVLTSSCDVGYINKSEVLVFLNKFIKKRDKLIYVPNLIPSIDSSRYRRCKNNFKELNVGLLGTDSNKKNYDKLFESVSDYPEKLNFYIYGHNNKYTSQLLSNFPNLSINIIESDKVDLVDFFSEINMIVSVSDHEGFGRPIAIALSLGLPCYLIANKVNREFFSSACFFNNIKELSNSLKVGNLTHLSTSDNYFVKINLKDFKKSIDEIRTRFD